MENFNRIKKKNLRCFICKFQGRIFPPLPQSVLLETDTPKKRIQDLPLSLPQGPLHITPPPPPPALASSSNSIYPLLKKIEIKAGFFLAPPLISPLCPQLPDRIVPSECVTLTAPRHPL